MKASKAVFLVMGNDLGRDERFSTYVLEGYFREQDAFRAADEYNHQAVIARTNKIYTVRLARIYEKWEDQ